MCGQLGFCKEINNYELAGGFTLHVFIFLCIAHPICLCVAMIV